MSEEIIYIDVKTLYNFMRDVFIGLKVPKKDAKICADVLISSDLRGIESHGVQRLKMYYDRIISEIQKPITKFEIIKETETTALIDAGHGMGHVAGHHAMELAIKKAKKFGTGAVAVRNSTHYGIAGYYALMAIQEGMIGLTLTNARPSIAPTFGVDPMLGTNPLTIGCPTDEDFPFLIDCATSITQRGKIEVLARTETPTPSGWVIDTNGTLSTDTVDILDKLMKGTAALLPLGGAGETLGGHKGYGYGTAVEIISAALTGGPFMKDLTLERGYKLGHFFLAINIESFLPLETFKKIAGNIVRELRNSKKAPGQSRIYTAGEKEYEMETQRRKTGIPINSSILKDLLVMREMLELSDYSF
ncbi:MAG: Ldh family oxidoreductase [Candidatus Heimdallarchaeota archaeon]|nr:MAG: Ldh family oxidoreductase [Candidatus Heimdallarchaeota archaeon]